MFLQEGFALGARRGQDERAEVLAERLGDGGIDRANAHNGVPGDC
ncbi:hypothetical protein ACX5K5_13810 [Glutamicibacter bergerei]